MDGRRVVQNDNYKLSLKVQGKNNFKRDRLIYNFWGEVGFHSQGNIVKNGSTIDFKPRYNFSTGIEMNTPHIPFNFGPSLEFESRSMAQYDDNGYFTRRDQIGWFGFNIDKKIQLKKNDLYLNALYSSKIAQRSLDGYDNFGASRFVLKASTHFTENYLIGLYSENISYAENSVKEERLFGLNFIYKIN